MKFFTNIFIFAGMQIFLKPLKSLALSQNINIRVPIITLKKVKL